MPTDTCIVTGFGLLGPDPTPYPTLHVLLGGAKCVGVNFVQIDTVF